MRIALAATLAFFAVWFVALRPKPPAPAPAPPAAAAAQSAPGQAAEQAQEAAGAAPAQPVQAKGGSGGIDVRKATDSTTSKAATAVLEDVENGKVAVLLFWDRRLSDDQAVHRAVMGLDRRGGKVAVHKAPVEDLAKFEPITRGVPVVTSPTVLVIDRTGRARSVGGLTVPSELNELVGKALSVKP